MPMIAYKTGMGLNLFRQVELFHIQCTRDNVFSGRIS